MSVFFSAGRAAQTRAATPATAGAEKRSSAHRDDLPASFSAVDALSWSGEPQIASIIGKARQSPSVINCGHCDNVW